MNHSIFTSERPTRTDVILRGSLNKSGNALNTSQTIFKIRISMHTKCGHECCLLVYEIWSITVIRADTVTTCTLYCESSWRGKS